LRIVYLALSSVPLQRHATLKNPFKALRRFWKRMTIVKRNEQLVHREDPDGTESLQNILRDEGIDIITNAVVERFEGKSGDAVKQHAMQCESKIQIDGSHLPVASGRTPNTQGIGLDLTGFETTESRHIKVNERFETTAVDVLVVGCCAGSPHFPHVAFDDFRIVRVNLSPGSVSAKRKLGSAGLAYWKAKLPMIAAATRTRTLYETKGCMKALVDTKSDRTL
jgi:pyruvate/2-oxoglutarate dehydrogenase complex dihydrolipoamide dehydrogenase (E3) component